ncbi:hypothetical protein [Alicycliphilus denitrificans]|uniref:hypothetical protein n=1 Tax=Alicycliphilus denitrificans TaxID=179636 RepID=UPI00384EC18C
MAALSMGQAFLAQAQMPSQPAWQPMREAVFDSSNFPSTASPEDRAIAQRIWANELMARLKDEQRFLPGFALIGDVREGEKRIVFSMFAAAASEHCEPAANGAAVQDIFVECRMRVVGWPPTGRHIAELPGYCMIYGGDHKKNRVEYRYDTSAQTLHFRTIQFGKVVPACSRALKLG